MKFALVLMLPLILAAGCREDSAAAELPEPVSLTEDAAGFYCQMTILEHPGPKAQVHLAGYPAPLWFSQVRDGIAYLKSLEQSAEIQGLYVNDMGRAVSWAEPGADNWIAAREAYFVVNSNAVGGMGAPEIVPFSQVESAREFVGNSGGRIMRLDEIPPEMVLSPVEFRSNVPEVSG